MTVDQARVRRESIRWHGVLTLNNARPIGAFEESILAVVQAVYPDATPLEVRQALDYLEARDLVDLDRQPHGRWHARLSRTGIDLAEYTVPCEPGIARPEKYW
ncbi:MAG: hypothetical protein HQL47_10300 [Gammaproteobacteria bacterium]|nr:hypothetical protein [Gammaproteobacteria bacterium]